MASWSAAFAPSSTTPRSPRSKAFETASFSAVRIASIILPASPASWFGVFGLGFFCSYGRQDLTTFSSQPRRRREPNRPFGTAAFLWASLTLALLTLPVVIVATEEALAAVPRSIARRIVACGASNGKTIYRIVLAAPCGNHGVHDPRHGHARGREVAPLCFVGPSRKRRRCRGGVFRNVHWSRSFMPPGISYL